MKKILVATALVFSAAFAWSADPVKQFKSNPKAAKQAMVDGKQAVLDGFKDPSSAQFRALFVVKDAILCGEVNAKNSYGGYVGFKRFINIGGTSVTYFEDERQEFLLDWGSLCLGMTESEMGTARK